MEGHLNAWGREFNDIQYYTASGEYTHVEKNGKRDNFLLSSLKIQNLP